MSNYESNERLILLKQRYETRKEELNEIQKVLNEADEMLLDSGIEIRGSVKDINEIVENVSKEKISEIKDISKAVIVSVDCERNNEEDVKNGGPNYLGYDFVVDVDNVEEMRHYITLLIKKNNQPLIKSYTKYDKNVKAEHIWTLEEIKECILKGYK